MTPEALEALKASIAHWERKVADPVGEKIGMDHCPLCAKFFNNNCVGCPIAEKTDLPNCRGTPFGDADDAEYDYEKGKISFEEFRAACQLELDFLKSLLPKEESK